MSIFLALFLIFGGSLMTAPTPAPTGIPTKPVPPISQYLDGTKKDSEGHTLVIDSKQNVWADLGGGHYRFEGFAAQSKTHTEITLGPLSSVVDFLKLLTSGNLWVRVGEFAVGAILLAAGAAALMRSNAGPATRNAKEAAKFVITKGKSK